MKSKKALLRVAPFLFVLLCALYGASHEIQSVQKYHNVDIRLAGGNTSGPDFDSQFFVAAWQKTPHFLDTLKWWYGPWGQVNRPFYRPIPSLLFWTQYQVFGIHGQFPFHVLLLAWHFVAVILIWRFLCVILGARDGTLATGLWSSNVADRVGIMFPGGALGAWKDNVESWNAIAVILCLWAFWRHLQSQSRRWQAAALVLFWLALCVKEMAYMAPFLMLLLAWYDQKWRQGLKAVIPFFTLAGAMFFFRFWALGGMGFRMGSNRHWLSRFFIDNLSAALAPVIHGEWLILATILSAVASWHLLKRRWVPGGVMLIIAAVSLVVSTQRSGFELAANVSRLLVISEWYIAPPMILTLFFWWRFFKQRNRKQIFGALWALIFYLPLTSGPNTSHIFYFVSVGWSIWLFYALLDIVKLAIGVYRRWDKAELRVSSSAT